MAGRRSVTAGQYPGPTGIYAQELRETMDMMVWLCAERTERHSLHQNCAPVEGERQSMYEKDKGEEDTCLGSDSRGWSWNDAGKGWESGDGVRLGL